MRVVPIVESINFWTQHIGLATIPLTVMSLIGIMFISSTRRLPWSLPIISWFNRRTLTIALIVVNALFPLMVLSTGLTLAHVFSLRGDPNSNNHGLASLFDPNSPNFTIYNGWHFNEKHGTIPQMMRARLNFGVVFSCVWPVVAFFFGLGILSIQSTFRKLGEMEKELGI